ncbi:MAG: helix-turn-helix domain-containing protein [Lachnospiraceae bacterium]|nr:helix-turn-helix domain-containing protein [Lachnospiraceae bacterium]
MYNNYAKIRDSRGLNDSKVSKATGIPRSIFSDWKSGRSNPKFDKIQAIADYLRVSLPSITGQNDVCDYFDENEKLLIEEYRQEGKDGKLHLLAYALAKIKDVKETKNE